MKTFNRQKLDIAHIIRRQLYALDEAKLLELVSQSDVVSGSIERCQTIRRKLGKCGPRRFQAAARRLRQQGIHALTDLRHELEFVVQQLNYIRPSIPSMRDVTEDLDQLKEEFSSWRYDRAENVLAVTTEPIELDSIYLGPFEISLHLQVLSDLSRRDACSVEALDPHPAAGADHVTHPHVSDNRLCAGEATTAIRTALEAGRISDFFLLIRSVLTTYNPESPYVSLDNWEGQPCADCGYRMHEESRYWCEACEQDFCDECASGCRCCDLTMCRGCLSGCQFCDEPVCGDCLVACVNCDTPCCKSCLENDLCPNCVEEMEHQDEEENHENELEQETSNTQTTAA